MPSERLSRNNSATEIYEGEVTNYYDPINKFYGIAYKDGDREEFIHEEVNTYRKKAQ